MGHNDGKLAGNPGEEYIGFRSGVVTGLSPGDTHIGLEMVNGPFHNGPYFIEGNPFIGIPLDAGEHAEVHVFISVSGASFFSRAAGFRTVTDPLPFYHVYFRADPFVTVRTAFFMAVSGVFHVQGGVFGAGGVAVSVIADFFKRAFIPGVIRDKGSGKMKFILKEAVSFDGVKGGIAKESIRAEPRVERKEIREGRL